MATRALTGNVEDLLSLAGVFAIAFVAATILPAQSEAALVGLLVLGKQPPVLLVIVATIGNVLGSVTNWLLGRWVEHYRHRRWFPVSEQALDRATGWYRRWGRWSLLLSWAPIGGDALTVAAGVLREPFWSFLLLVTIAKAGRYMVLTVITLGLL
ncbi:Inner membrane protein YqaA [bioreactor metagenome]|jgi:membrane protein YqaA with SNARE-associated domain|uniref:Inner membrane protein YqaA n=1 Tax=bioreactor metagenome TaxID=1076179 RepID=A0A644UKU1_9ZZZZ|nr:YqaA family protein [Paracoccus kondratievae]QFQ88889.1 DedA family protein [Paracoccus kondratievae]